MRINNSLLKAVKGEDVGTLKDILGGLKECNVRGKLMVCAHRSSARGSLQSLNAARGGACAACQGHVRARWQSRTVPADARPGPFVHRICPSPSSGRP